MELSWLSLVYHSVSNVPKLSSSHTSSVFSFSGEPESIATLILSRLSFYHIILSRSHLRQSCFWHLVVQTLHSARCILPGFARPAFFLINRGGADPKSPPLQRPQYRQLPIFLSYVHRATYIASPSPGIARVGRDKAYNADPHSNLRVPPHTCHPLHNHQDTPGNAR